MGTAEVNTIVRIFATGADGKTHQIGQGVVGSDATDGTLDNGLGKWEVTVEPLKDGNYTIFTTLEDTAGNISASSPGTSITVSDFILKLSLAASYPTVTSPQSVATGNLNGDGRLDMVTSGNEGTLQVFYGRGDGTFFPGPVLVTGGGSSISVALADINKDGKLDIVTANEATDNVSVLYGGACGRRDREVLQAQDLLAGRRFAARGDPGRRPEP